MHIAILFAVLTAVLSFTVQGVPLSLSADRNEMSASFVPRVVDNPSTPPAEQHPVTLPKTPESVAEYFVLLDTKVVSGFKGKTPSRRLSNFIKENKIKVKKGKLTPLVGLCGFTGFFTEEQVNIMKENKAVEKISIPGSMTIFCKSDAQHSANGPGSCSPSSNSPASKNNKGLEVDTSSAGAHPHIGEHPNGSPQDKPIAGTTVNPS